MIELGKYNNLRITRQAPPGLYLTDLQDTEEVLLPNKFVTANMNTDDVISVFVYNDSEDRLVATTQKSFIELNGFAALEVVDVTEYGAFLDWGLDKHLFVPFRNQARKMEEGKKYIVYLYEDESSDRLVASSKYNSYLESEDVDLYESQEVNLLICGKTDLGYNCIINDKYQGLIYQNEIFRRIEFGQRTVGYVKKLRDDNKVDVILEKQGFMNIEPNAEKLLNYIKEKNGAIRLTDKSDPEQIKAQLGMSKKVFKKALGSLYKQRLVEIGDEGVKLVV